MRILVVGAFGYLGGRIASYLAECAHEIVLASSREMHSADWLVGSSVLRINWSDFGSLQSACESVDIVIHAAGMNAADCKQNPVQALEFNGVLTSKLALAAGSMSVSKFIYLSTVHVYKSMLEGRITDSACPENIHPYASSHLAGESAVLFAASQNNMNGIVLRLSNCFGKPVHKNTNCWYLLANDLCRQAVTEKTLSLSSNGKQFRDFINIGKLCRDIECLIKSDINYDRPLNISAGSSISVIQMTKLVQDRCASKFGYVPEIIANDMDSSEAGELLEIVPSDCIMEFGHKTDFNHEIDELLACCSEEFS